MKEPFKVGDRVAMYHSVFRAEGRVLEVQPKGLRIAWMSGDDNLRGIQWFSRWQCRRLVKKERRRVWVNPRFIPAEPSVMIRCQCGPQIISSTGPQDGFIEFTEVKQKDPK